MKKDKECCPKFDTKRWDKKTFKWKNKLFIKESIPALFHFPLFPPIIGKKILKMWDLAKKSKACSKNMGDILVLFYDPTPFKSELYFTVTKKVANAHNVKISGTFMTKIFDGPYNAIPKFIKQMDKYLATKNKKAKRYLVHYAYCPKCSKKYGHNYMILFAEV